jgi:hypothetical protein
MLNSKNIAEIVGWYGTFAILLAYALVSFNIIPATGYLYQLLNLTGAIGIVVISLAKKAKQPAALNVAWAVIAFVAIISLVIHN